MFTKKFFLINLIFMVVFIKGYSQKESANWYFGEYAGLTFNYGIAQPLINSSLITTEGCATISDSNGNLLFYTDGVSIWDRKHELMPNGDKLLGHSSSSMAAIIIPKPGSVSNYYVFTVDKPSYYLTENDPISGVNYSEVDMSLNDGYGDIVSANKNTHLITYNLSSSLEKEYKSSEKISAVTSSDGRSIWVVTYFINKFYAFKVSEDGVNSTAVISSVNESVYPTLNADGANITAIGYMKVSPNGKKIAIAHSSTNGGNPRDGTKQSGKVFLYDFNNLTGEVSNQVEMLNGGYPYGIEFSPNSELLYVTNSIFDSSDLFVESQLLQYNLSSNNNLGSKQTIKSSQNIAGALQLAIDGKIYRAGYQVLSLNSSISVINSPNALGAACNYLENTVTLGNKLPKLGLPPFIQSLFLYSFDYEFTCLGDQTHFFITSEDPFDSVLWDFGDGITSTEIDIYHEFTQSGVYPVSLTLSLNGVERDPVIKQVIISEPPMIISEVYELVQCDLFDSNSEDGLASFNLELANSSISLEDDESVIINYYRTEAEAIADTLNINSLNAIYRNEVIDEIVYAKVLRPFTNCYNIASVKLKALNGVDLGLTQVLGCDFNKDSYADFDLSLESQRIIDKLSLPNDINISFYENIIDAQYGTNRLEGNYYSYERTIYVRASGNNICYGIGELDLNVQSFVNVDDHLVLFCKDDFPVNIESGVPEHEILNYSYEWNATEKSNNLLVYQPGFYDVLITNNISGCSKSIRITVEEVEDALISDVQVGGLSASVILENDNKEPFVFRIDSQTEYQQSNLFEDLNPGLHIVHVSDINFCNIIDYEFYIFGFPNFFTPNGDGYNDTWNVFGLNEVDFQDDILTIYIFNRYGKLLKSFNPFLSSWDGTFKGEVLSNDDYWYKLRLPEGKVYTGHFTLKR